MIQNIYLLFSSCSCPCFLATVMDGNQSSHSWQHSFYTEIVSVVTEETVSIIQFTRYHVLETTDYCVFNMANS